MLGDVVERALARVGVTPGRVERVLGRPCACQDRKEKLDDLQRWAVRTLRGAGGAAEHLRRLLCG